MDGNDKTKLLFKNRATHFHTNGNGTGSRLGFENVQNRLVLGKADTTGRNRKDSTSQEFFRPREDYAFNNCVEALRVHDYSDPTRNSTIP